METSNLPAALCIASAQVEKAEAARYCLRLQTAVAELGLDFGAASQANGSLNLLLSGRFGWGRERKFPSSAEAGFGSG